MAATEQLHRLTDDFSTTRLAPTEERVIYVCPRCRTRSYDSGFCCCRPGGTAFRRATKSDLMDPSVGRRP